MPHRCTKCGAVFGDGDSVILTGCPECKWNKFFYVRPEDVKANPENKVESRPSATVFEVEEQPQTTDWKPAPAIEQKIEARVAEEQGKSIDSVLEDIDRALDSDDVNKKELDTDRVDSIRILGTGSYELNLGSIMEKEEIVVGIKEEGQYAIDLPMMLQKSGKASKKKKK